MPTLLSKVKANLILEHDADDELLQRLIDAAISYAESYQHLTAGTYEVAVMPATNFAPRSPKSAPGRWKSSSGRTRPRASSSCRAGGLLSEPSHG